LVLAVSAFLAFGAPRAFAHQQNAVPRTHAGRPTLPAQACTAPALDFRELQRDSNGVPVPDANGAPIWLPAVAMGTDGQSYQLTSAFFLPTVTVQPDARGSPELTFDLTDAGALLLRQISTRNLNRPLAIFIDNTLWEAPIVSSPLDGELQITGPNVGGRVGLQALADRLNSEVATDCAPPPVDASAPAATLPAGAAPVLVMRTDRQHGWTASAVL
jgi:hypothetical protein